MKKAEMIEWLNSLENDIRNMFLDAVNDNDEESMEIEHHNFKMVQKIKSIIEQWEE